MIDLVVYGHVETNSFTLLKTLFSDKIKAIQILEKIQDGGADRNQFAGMLYRALKLYLFMIDLDEVGLKDSRDIASFLKMNPYQVKTEYANIGVLKTNKQNIEKFYIGLVKLDIGIKSGKYPNTHFRLGTKKLVNELV
ncbi:MAG: hypothetical protein WC010_00295 [Candidatus Absconditabacterales bacterium]